jgi:class 3 adenylate cyclase/DNA-binding MarR family transcriptional regulator
VLEDAAREAWRGAVRIVSVRGDAGIGKTSLVDQLVPSWLDAGAEIHTASCQEDAGVPLLPVLVASLGRLGPGPGGGRGATEQLDRSPGLFVELSRRLLEHARHRPVVVRIDDVHWADPATADLLEHLVTAAGREALVAPISMLFVLGTRPDPDGPAAGLLERVRREPTHRRILLGPLDELAVNELLESYLGARPSRRLLDDVLDLTEGNPLFVRSLLDHLLELGALEVDQEEVVAVGTVVAEHAELSGVLSSRLDRLPVDARRVIRIAAYLGDANPIDELAEVVDLDPAAFDSALDELERARLLIERTEGEYWFPHPMVRQLLTRHDTARARRRMHHAIAERLVAILDDDDPDSALRIAHHFRRAGHLAAEPDTLVYARRAVGRSVELGAWAKAARYADLALEVLVRHPQLERDGELQRLHIAAAHAHFRNHDAVAASGHCARAIAVARERGDLATWGEALLIAHRTTLTLRGDVGADPDRHRELEEYVATLGELLPATRARCWQLLTEVHVTSGDLVRAGEAAGEAIRIATELGDDAVLAEVRFALGLQRFGGLDPLGAAAEFRTSIDHADRCDDTWVRAWSLGRLAMSQIQLGSLDEARYTTDHALDLDHRTQHWAEAGLATAARSLIKLAVGDLVGSERDAEDALALHARSSFPYIASLAWPLLVYGRALRDDHLGVSAALDGWESSGVRGSRRFALLAAVLTTESTEPAGALSPDRYRPAALGATNVFSAGALAIDVELGVRIGRQDLVLGALGVLGRLRERSVELLLPVGCSTGRLTGMGLVALGEVDEGVEVLADTERRLRSMGAMTEALRCAVERFVALAPSGLEGMEEEIVALAAELDARSLLAFHHRLRAVLPTELGANLRLRRTVVAWDLVSSTPLLERVGDDGYVALINDLNEMIHEELRAHHGIAFKYTGDGVYAWFREAADALRCARAVRMRLEHRNVRSADAPISMRTGIAVGRPASDAGDLFGVAVVTASRLCGLAERDQVLCTAETADDAAAHASSAIGTSPVGSVRLKGLSRAVDVVELVRLPV